ncbi:unnamed protein product [Fraxinus pennsylvanica]|uniref:Proteasome subunit beta n=1 Tax=Fraxinus pennsylvanica TaxID=56036 RepID=A0AAD2E6L3_9LAMI|nr:unnamed protein product [Fraxinus pennsylvanica]
MGSSQQQKQQEQVSGGNNIHRIEAIPETPPAGGQYNQIHEKQKPEWRNFLSYVGPGFLVSLAYLDPGNLETDLQAGANHGYELLWVILIGLIFALVIQSLAANLGVSTGKHLSELCKAEYPRYVRYCLWILAEIAVIAADIPEEENNSFTINFSLYLFMSIFEYNGSALVAMVGKNCFAIASDRRLGVQLQTIATDFQKIYKIHDKLFIGLSGLATDAQTLYQRLVFRHKLYELREERDMKPETFSSLVSALLYEKRRSSI